MKRLIRRLLGHRPHTSSSAEFAALAPDESLAVIGDIHGVDGLLERLLRRLEGAPAARLVFVGDYIDRGENSAQVLDRLFALSRQEPRPVFLKGNHEEMMLRFISDPGRPAQRWLRYGGLQTLASFGIGNITAQPSDRQALAARDALVEALGPEKIAWLEALPASWKSGNVAIVHAAADPRRPIDAQPREALLWGHRDFRKVPRQDGIWVVHGHSIVTEVAAEDGCIGVDTGAYATGRLSAALIGPGGFEAVSCRWHDPE